ncbi:IclR family transcriptional regulator [Streptomyces fractus]|uniref:IclR family transcriptional regulator n=1 Tax=Streptomyces fractus TaxID=641806 RepID=UPI003CEE38BF
MPARAATPALPDAPSPDEPRLTAAGRVLSVLSAFGPRHRSLTLSEIARRAELSLPTAYRLTRELVAWGVLERGPDRRFTVGLRLLELSALAPRGLRLREAAFPYLDDLHERTRGNVHLGVRDGHEVVYVETLRARVGNPLSSRVGDRRPLHVTGTGLVLLAYAAQEVQDEVLASPLQRLTPMTLTDPAALRAELAEIRRTGVAVARGRITLPDLVVAVPVSDPDGRTAAAISVVVDAATARPRELTALLTRTARSITRSLGPAA